MEKADMHQGNLFVDAEGRLVEEIALVHVGMEKAVAHRMQQEGLDHLCAEPLHVVARIGKRGAVGSGNALDPLHRHDALRGALPVDLRHAETGVFRRVLRHLRHRRRFQAKIHFKLHAVGKRLHDLDGAKPSRPRM